MIEQIQDIDVKRIYEFMQCGKNPHLFNPCKDKEDIIAIAALKENLYSQLENAQDLNEFLPKTPEECNLISGKQELSETKKVCGSLVQLGLMAHISEAQIIEALIALMLLSLKDKGVFTDFEKARNLFITKMLHQKQRFNISTKALKFAQKANSSFFEDYSENGFVVFVDKMFFEVYRLMFLPSVCTIKAFETANKELEVKLEQMIELSNKMFSEKTDTLLQSKTPRQFFLNILDLVDFQLSANRRCGLLKECFSFQLLKQKEDYINSRFRRTCVFFTLFTCELGVSCFKACVYSLLTPF